MSAVGSVIGVVKLKNMYDAYAVMVLSRFIEQVRQEKVGKKRPPAKYKITKQLPTDKEYAELKQVQFTSDAESLVSEAQGEVESLAEEMRTWYDNLTDNLQQNEKGQQVESAADALEGFNWDNVPDICTHIPVYSLPALNANSRADRASAAASQLEDVKEAICQWIEENRDPSKEDESGETVMEIQNGNETVNVTVNWADLESYAEGLETIAGEINDVEFPGMYG